MKGLGLLGYWAVHAYVCPSTDSWCVEHERGALLETCATWRVDTANLVTQRRVLRQREVLLPVSH